MTRTKMLACKNNALHSGHTRNLRVNLSVGSQMNLFICRPLFVYLIACKLFVSFCLSKMYLNESVFWIKCLLFLLNKWARIFLILCKFQHENHKKGLSKQT